MPRLASYQQALAPARSHVPTPDLGVLAHHTCRVVHASAGSHDSWDRGSPIEGWRACARADTALKRVCDMEDEASVRGTTSCSRLCPGS